MLQSIIKQQRFEAQEVYLYYMRYAILLQVNLHHLSRVASEELFNFYHGDAIIFAENLDWLIAYSLEDEWRAGWKNSNN